MKQKLFIISIFVGLNIAASAQNQNIIEVSYKIASQNPQIIKLQHEIDAQTHSAKAENSLDNPEIEFERLWHSGNGENRWSAGISQGFKWPGVYTIGNSRIRAGQNVASARLAVEKADVANKIGNAIISHLEATEKKRILGTIDSVWSAISHSTAREYEQGLTNILQVNRSAVQAALVHA